jgi:DNA invertase Pin-like site-specific DNA recombinase
VTPTTSLKAAIYARVSTSEQNYAMQFREVREYCERMGWSTVEYAEQASSVKRRPVLARLMADAKRRAFDIVVVWKLDRFARSLMQLIENVQLLDSAGIRFICVTQAIDTDKRNPMSRLTLQIMGAFAEFERAIIVERVQSGLNSYRDDYAKGKVGAEGNRKSHSGKNLPAHRPKKIWRRDRALELREQGLSFRKIAAQLGQSEASVRRAIKTSGG